MKGDLVLFDSFRGRGAAVWLKDGRLHDVVADPMSGRPAPGEIYRARATRPMKGLGGAMLEGPDGPLFLRRAGDLAPGRSVIVQVTGYPDRGKAPPVTRRLTLKGRFAIVTPEAPGLNISKAIRDEEKRVGLRELIAPFHDVDGPGLILRSAAEKGAYDAIADEAMTLLDFARRIAGDVDGAPELLLDAPDAREIAWRDWPVESASEDGGGAFAHHDVETQIEEALLPSQPLPSGAGMTIETTRALVAIDIDTGGDTSPAAGLKATLAAARELPRLLRIKGLGGQIVIDPAPFPKKDRRMVERALTTAFRADSIETAILGWSPGGLIELQRKRERLALSELFA